MKALIHITLKQGVLDPQGKAIGLTLGAMGYSGVGQVRQGKYLELELDETDEAKARAQVEEMCEWLLANMFIEDYRIALEA